MHGSGVGLSSPVPSVSASVPVLISVPFAPSACGVNMCSCVPVLVSVPCVPVLVSVPHA